MIGKYVIRFVELCTFLDRFFFFQNSIRFSKNPSFKILMSRRALGIVRGLPFWLNFFEKPVHNSVWLFLVNSYNSIRSLLNNFYPFCLIHIFIVF